MYVQCSWSAVLLVPVGKPIEVALNLTPSQEQIDRLHADFTKELIDMFEREKHKYITKANTTHLIIDWYASSSFQPSV